MPLTRCESCGSEHLGPVPCGLTFRERVATTQVHGSVLESRTPVSRYDHEALDDQFGGTRKERKEEFLADTRGMGKLKHVPGGALYRDRKTDTVAKISDAQIEREFATPK